MDLVTNMLEFPFDDEWKFHRADLLALKDTEYGCLKGKSYYSYKIFGLQYYLIISPYGNQEKNLGQTWIFLHVNGSEERKITANFTISIQSANYESDEIVKVYREYDGCGETCGTTDEFFDSKKKFFVDGEITIRVKGMFKVARTVVTKLSCPISTEWKIKEADLNALKESSTGNLRSKRFYISTFSEVEYYLAIHPAKEGYTWIVLQIDMGNEKQIEAVFDVSIQSANDYQNFHHVFDKSEGFGYKCCSTSDLFDAEKNYIVDGFLIIKLNGILMVEKKETTTLKLKKGVATPAAQKQKNKKFTIIIGKKELKVHKKVLIDASPVFAAMLNSEMKESKENHMEITDFSYDIVDAAIKLCYSSGIRKVSSSLQDMISLYKFADKYDIKLITEFLEEHLIKKILHSNVCQLIEFSKSMNVKKLYQKCIEFLMDCSKKSIPVYGANILDKDFLAEIFLNSLCPVVATDV